jgi:hypothetical protein
MIFAGSGASNLSEVEVGRQPRTPSRRMQCSLILWVSSESPSIADRELGPGSD